MHAVKIDPAPPPRRGWGILALSVIGLAAAGVSRFGGTPRALPLDEALRTLVACPGAQEAELALAVIGSRAHELAAVLAAHERQGGRYAGTYLDRIVETIQKERSR